MVKKMSYSTDFKQLVLSKLEFKSYRELEREFSISKSSILNWKREIETQEDVNGIIRKHKHKEVTKKTLAIKREMVSVLVKKA